MEQKMPGGQGKKAANGSGIPGNFDDGRAFGLSPDENTAEAENKMKPTAQKNAVPGKPATGPATKGSENPS